MDHYRSISALSLIAACSTIASPAVAQGVSIQPRATIGYEFYKFDGEDDGTNNQLGDINFESDYLVGGLGLTLQTGRFFIDLYGQKNLSEADNLDEDSFDALALDQVAERFNINFSIGYSITPRISVIGGIKYSRTDIEGDINFDDDVLELLFPDDFLNIDVEYIGPYLGGAFAIPVANVGYIVLNGSASYLLGETTVDANVLGEVLADDLKIDGESLGYSLGVTWSGTFNPNSPTPTGLGYSIGVDYSAYQFSDDGVDEFSEATLRGKVDLRYRF